MLSLKTTTNGTRIKLLDPLKIIHDKMFSSHKDNSLTGIVKQISYDLNTGKKTLKIETEPF